MLAFVPTFKFKGVKIVYFAEISERPKIKKEEFQRAEKETNKIMNNSAAVKFVTLCMRFPNDYANDSFQQAKRSERVYVFGETSIDVSQERILYL